MRRLKTEIAIIGSGSAAMLAANRLVGQGSSVVLINPTPQFGIEDLRPHHGLGLWNAAYRAEGDNQSLPDLYEQLCERMREVFPATVDQSGLKRCEHWSVLSSTPIHRGVTEDLERDYFKLERKPWSAGHFRLVNPEHVLARTRRLGLDLPVVAQLEGAIVRDNGLWWDAARMGMYLCQFIHNRFSTKDEATERYFVNAQIKGRYGRKVVIETSDGDELSIESERGVLMFLTGELLPHVKSIVAACEEPWIQGVRKRRREQHFIWFERHAGALANQDEELWIELGGTRYRWDKAAGTATWTSERGPDGLERVVDEGLRLHCLPRPTTRFVSAQRAFRLEWEWKTPQWRQTSHDTYWATCFEGDLWNIMELVWNLPRL